MLGWVPDVPLQIDTLQPLKFKDMQRWRTSKNWNHLNQLLPFEVQTIRRQLKQLSKVSVRCHFQEYFFEIFSANYYQSICELIFNKIQCFNHILLKTFKRMRLYYENCSLRSILF